MNVRPWVLILILVLGNQAYCQWVKTECPERVGAFAIIDNNIFIETSDRIFLSTDEGHSWKTADSGITSQHVHSLAVSGNNIFAGTNSGVFLSTDNGTSWTAINAGFANSEIMSLTVSGSTIYVGTVDSGFFYSINNGSSWTQFDFAPMNFIVSFFAVSNNTMYAGGDSYCSACLPAFNMFCSNDHGLSWRRDTVFDTHWASSLVVDGDHFFAGTYSGGVLLSTDNGKNGLHKIPVLRI